MTEYNKIVKIAKEIKSEVENNHKMPRSHKWVYWFAKSILNPGKSVKGKSGINGPLKAEGTKFKKKIPLSFLKAWGKQAIKYIDKYGRTPSYAAFNGEKIHPYYYCYMYALAIDFYQKHGKLHKYVVLDTTLIKPAKKKYGHATKHCCNNMGQNNGYFCGPHSLQEVFRNLTNIVVPQSTIAEVCGTTEDGTDHDGLNTCVAWFNRKYGYNLSVEWKNFSDLGWDGIKKIVNSKNQDCVVHNLYRNKYGHYEVINNISDFYIYVQNSLGDRCDYPCYYGYVENRTFSEYRSYIGGISQKSIMVITNR